MTEILEGVMNLLQILSIALAIRFFVANILDVSYTVGLVLVGLAISVSGIHVDIQLSHDLILFVILPTIVFRAALEINFDEFKRNVHWALSLVTVGLPLSVLLLGLLSAYAFHFPLLISLLFAAIIFPVDPAAVTSIYQELDVPERLVVLAESESLLDDGLGIVVFFSLFSLFQQAAATGRPLVGLMTPTRLGSIGLQVLVVSVGGAAVGVITGLAAAFVLQWVREQMAAFLLTMILAYGSFVLADAILGVNGIIATVAAGLTIGRAGTPELPADVHSFVDEVWNSANFLVNTVIYVLIGVKVPIGNFLTYADLVAVGIVLVTAVRAIEVYTVVGITNFVSARDIPFAYQQVLVWGGIHTVVPIALVLTLPEGMPFREQLWTMVFGVAVTSIIIQGLLMPTVLQLTGLAGAEESPEVEEPA